MFALPEIHGKYPVGSTTFVAPVKHRLNIGSARLANGDRALPPLEQVTFTAYYPAQIPSSGSPKGVHWIVRPLSTSLAGFSRFGRISVWILWPIVYLFGVFLKAPVHEHAPLLKPQTTTGWPLVLFSHGLGGSRMAYSQFCSRIAASGKVVLAIEHHDGTGHACTIESEAPRTVLYLQEEDVTWSQDKGDSGGSSSFRLRSEQLSYRIHELYLSFSAFSSLVNGKQNADIKCLDKPSLNLSNWVGRSVNLKEDVCLSGHSFGGCTVFSFISSSAPSELYTPIPIGSCLVLDPWLEPIPSPGPIPLFISTSAFSSRADSRRPSVEVDTLIKFEDSNSNNGPHPRLLVINSEAFTLWKDHFTRLQSVVKDWRPEGRLLTLVRSQHASFSDFLLLPLIRKKASKKFMDIICRLSVDFLDGDVDTALQSISTKNMEVEIIGKRKDGRPRRRLIGKIGDVICH